jgi:hypothetical protein
MLHTKSLLSFVGIGQSTAYLTSLCDSLDPFAYLHAPAHPDTCISMEI